MKLTCKHISCAEFRRNLSNWSNEAVFGRTPVIVNRREVPSFVLIGFAEFNEYFKKYHPEQEFNHEYFGDLKED